MCGVLGLRQSRLDHGKTGLHEHDKESRDQRPHHVDRHSVVTGSCRQFGQGGLAGRGCRHVGGVTGGRASWVVAPPLAECESTTDQEHQKNRS